MKERMNQEGMRKKFWNVFYVASFLFITIFFVLPYLVQISTYFHERSHQQMFTKYGIESNYQVNLIETIPNFYNPYVDKLGVTSFDFDAYNKLDKFKKADINVAGIISDLRFLFLIAIYLLMVNVYTYYKVKVKKDYNLMNVLAVNWILFMWLLALIQITLSNITLSIGDVYSLIRVIGVCIFLI